MIRVYVERSRDAWRAEIIPLSLFAISISIAYHRELALITSAALALAVVLTLGYGLPEFIILVAAAAAPILLIPTSLCFDAVSPQDFPHNLLVRQFLHMAKVQPNPKLHRMRSRIPRNQSHSI